jgi:hypothetical protein
MYNPARQQQPPILLHEVLVNSTFSLISYNSVLDVLFIVFNYIISPVDFNVVLKVILVVTIQIRLGSQERT